MNPLSSIMTAKCYLYVLRISYLSFHPWYFGGSFCCAAEIDWFYSAYHLIWILWIISNVLLLLSVLLLFLLWFYACKLTFLWITNSPPPRQTLFSLLLALIFFFFPPHNLHLSRSILDGTCIPHLYPEVSHEAAKVGFLFLIFLPLELLLISFN